MLDPNAMLDEGMDMGYEAPVAPPPLPEPQASAKRSAPKGARTSVERQKLGMRICQAHRRGIEQKGNLPDRIKRNEEFYENRNIKPAKLPWAGAPFFHIPLTKPRIKKRKDALVQAILAPEVAFRFKKIGQQDSVKDVEHDVQLALEWQDWQQDLDAGGQIAMIANNVMFRVTFQEHPHGFEKAVHTGPFCGPVIEVAHPDYTVVFPATPGPLTGKRLIATCSEVRAADIHAAIKRKEFFEDVKLGGQADERIRKEHEKDGDLQNLNVVSDEEEDRNINKWDGLWRDDLDGKGEKWYRVQYRLDGDTLLRIDEYPEDLPLWYAAGQIDKEYGVHWTEGSPAQDLQGLQILMNATVNQFFWTLQRLSAQTVLAERSNADPGELVDLPPGAYVPVKNLGKTAVIGGAGSLQGSDVLIQLIRQFADGASSVSDSVTGAPSVGRESTATEENIKWAGFQMTGSADVTAMAPCLVQIAKIIVAMLYKYWDRFSECYGDALAIQDREVLKQPYVIEIAGKAPEDSPQAQMDQARLIMELAAQFPEEGIPISELIRMIIQNSGLTNKEDLINAIDEQASMMGNMDPMQLLQGMMGGTATMGGLAEQGQPLDEAGIAAILQSILATGTGVPAQGAGDQSGGPLAILPTGA